MKRVVFVTAPEVFRDEEYYKPKKILEKAGVEVITSSVKIGELIGRFGYKTESTVLISNINCTDFDAIVYIGGVGASVFFEDNDALRLANEFFKQNKPVASICIAGVILANSGILKGKKATVYIDGKKSLIRGGADYTGRFLEVDGNVITANGPDAAEELGKSILKALQ
ncbi:MAG: DJ-1/PfpI family protein [Endomicrobium sp.]|jgi:protease I|nr:DJ-1/PfpI family protein [Endomicrobium sp.]MDR2398826.1 DJ-1/PfpI family protein [Endomicrobium sp.]